MAEKPESRETVSLEELLVAHMIQIEALTLLLIEKGVFTQEEFFTRLKQVQVDHEKARQERQ